MKAMHQRLRTTVVLLGGLALTVPLASAEAQDTTATGQDTMPEQQAAGDTAARDTAQHDSTAWGYAVDSTAEVQNPPGYRGMERDTTAFPPQEDTAAAADPTGRIEQRAVQDSLEAGEQQNPPGYRGMERPAALDSAAQPSDTAAAAKTTTKKDKTTSKKDKTTTKKKQESSKDTSSTVRTGQDTTSDTTRSGVNAEEESGQSNR
ncbi:MAG: hypothetical protein ACREMZ_11670 [Gemmatimonadales bacterium]